MQIPISWLKDILAAKSSPLEIGLYGLFAVVVSAVVGLVYTANFYGIPLRSGLAKPTYWAFLGALFLTFLAMLWLPLVFSARTTLPLIGVAAFELPGGLSLQSQALQDGILHELRKRMNAGAPLLVRSITEPVRSVRAAQFAGIRRRLDSLLWIEAAVTNGKIRVRLHAALFVRDGKSEGLRDKTYPITGGRLDRSLEALASDAADLIIEEVAQERFMSAEYDSAAELLDTVTGHASDTLSIWAISHCRRKFKDLGAAVRILSNRGSQFSTEERKKVLKEIQEVGRVERERLNTSVSALPVNYHSRFEKLVAFSNLGLYQFAVEEAKGILSIPDGPTSAERDVVNVYLEINLKRGSQFSEPAELAGLVFPDSGSTVFFEIGGCFTQAFAFRDGDLRLVGVIDERGNWTIDGAVFDSEGRALATIQRGVIVPDQANISELAIDGPRKVLFDRFNFPALSTEEVQLSRPIEFVVSAVQTTPLTMGSGSPLFKGLRSERFLPAIIGGNGALKAGSTGNIERVVRVSGFLYDQRGQLAAELSSSRVAGYRGMGFIGKFQGVPRTRMQPFEAIVLMFGASSAPSAEEEP